MSWDAVEEWRKEYARHQALLEAARRRVAAGWSKLPQQLKDGTLMLTRASEAVLMVASDWLLENNLAPNETAIPYEYRRMTRPEALLVDALFGLKKVRSKWDYEFICRMKSISLTKRRRLTEKQAVHLVRLVEKYREELTRNAGSLTQPSEAASPPTQPRT